MKNGILTIAGLFYFLLPGLSQKQLVMLESGNVVGRYSEGQYFRCVLKKNHRHTEGHIIELHDFSMITSSDTIKFQDILKVDIHKHRPFRWNSGVGGLLFISGILYFGIDRANAAIGVNSSDLPQYVWVTSSILTGVGAAMIFIRPRYTRVNTGVFLHTVDYTSPYYLRQ